MVLVRKVGAVPRIPPERYEPVLLQAREHLEDAKQKLITAQTSITEVQTKYGQLQNQVDQVKQVSLGRWPFMRKKTLRRILENSNG